MAERETKSTAEQEKTRRRQETQPVAEQSKQGGLLEYSQLSEILSGMSFIEQSALLNGSGLVGTQKAEAILALQQTYGNSYMTSLAEGNDRMNPGEGFSGAKLNTGAKPLEPHIRSQMENAFRKDLGSVKVVEGDGVAKSAGDLAVTTGETIHFAPGSITLKQSRGVTYSDMSWRISFSRPLRTIPLILTSTWKGKQGRQDIGLPWARKYR